MVTQVSSKKIRCLRMAEDGNIEKETKVDVYKGTPVSVGCGAPENPPTVVLDGDEGLGPEQCTFRYRNRRCLEVTAGSRRKFKCYRRRDPVAWGILEVPEFVVGRSHFAIKKLSETEAEVSWSPFDESKTIVLCKWDISTCLFLGSTPKTQEEICTKYKSWVEPMPIVLQRTPEDDKTINWEHMLLRYYEKNFELLCLSENNPVFHALPDRPLLLSPNGLIYIGYRTLIHAL